LAGVLLIGISVVGWQVEEKGKEVGQRKGGTKGGKKEGRKERDLQDHDSCYAL